MNKPDVKNAQELEKSFTAAKLRVTMVLKSCIWRPKRKLSNYGHNLFSYEPFLASFSRYKSFIFNSWRSPNIRPSQVDGPSCILSWCSFVCLIIRSLKHLYRIKIVYFTSTMYLPTTHWPIGYHTVNTYTYVVQKWLDSNSGSVKWKQPTHLLCHEHWPG